jgi:hypothetical protein
LRVEVPQTITTLKPYTVVRKLKLSLLSLSFTLYSLSFLSLSLSPYISFCFLSLSLWILSSSLSLLLLSYILYSLILYSTLEHWGCPVHPLSSISPLCNILNVQLFLTVQSCATSPNALLSLFFISHISMSLILSNV